MSDAGKPCYNASSLQPAYKSGGTQPIYKGVALGLTTITFVWGEDGSDLDICAYWDGQPNSKAGYGYSATAGQKCTSPYYMEYSGDVKTQSGAEWVKIKKSNWTSAQTFRIYFNFYGYSSSHPGNTCKIVASQAGGKTLFKTQTCATNAGQKAASSGSRYVAIVSFDSSGNLQSIT